MIKKIENLYFVRPSTFESIKAENEDINFVLPKILFSWLNLEALDGETRKLVALERDAAASQAEADQWRTQAAEAQKQIATLNTKADRLAEAQAAVRPSSPEPDPTAGVTRGGLDPNGIKYIQFS